MTQACQIEKALCYHCYAVVDVGDNFCRRCGAPLGEAAADPRAAAWDRPDRSRRPSRWSESPWTVLPALFLLFGPLALPMLWRSRRFPTVWKIILTTTVLAVTATAFGLVWYVFYKSLEPLRHLGELHAS